MRSISSHVNQWIFLSVTKLYAGAGERKSWCDTSRGVLSTIAHKAASSLCSRLWQEPKNSAESGLMKLSMVSSAVTEENVGGCFPFIRAAPRRVEEAHSDCVSLKLSRYKPTELVR